MFAEGLQVPAAPPPPFLAAGSFPSEQMGQGNGGSEEESRKGYFLTLHILQVEHFVHFSLAWKSISGSALGLTLGAREPTVAGSHVAGKWGPPAPGYPPDPLALKEQRDGQRSPLSPQARAQHLPQALPIVSHPGTTPANSEARGHQQCQPELSPTQETSTSWLQTTSPGQGLPLSATPGSNTSPKGHPKTSPAPRLQSRTLLAGRERFRVKQRWFCSHPATGTTLVPKGGLHGWNGDKWHTQPGDLGHSRGREWVGKGKHPPSHACTGGELPARSRQRGNAKTLPAPQGPRAGSCPTDTRGVPAPRGC